MAPASSMELLDIQANYLVWIHSEARRWHDNNIQSNAMYRYVFKTQLNHLVSLAKWLSVPLRTKWLWVQILLLLVNLHGYIVCHKGSYIFLTISPNNTISSSHGN